MAQFWWFRGFSAFRNALKTARYQSKVAFTCDHHLLHPACASHAVPAHDPSPPRRHAHRARPAAGARARRRARHARERSTSHGPRSATRRTRVDRGGPSARPRAARALAAALPRKKYQNLTSIPYFTPPRPKKKRFFFQRKKKYQFFPPLLHFSPPRSQNPNGCGS